MAFYELLIKVLMNYLLFNIIPLCNVKLSTLIRDYAIQLKPFKNVKVLRTSVLELLVLKDPPAQTERNSEGSGTGDLDFNAYKCHFSG